MMREIIGAGLDLSYLLWFWIPGILVTYRLGFRYVTDVLPIGFLFSSAVTTLTFAVVYPLGLSVYTVETARVILLIVGVLLLFMARRDITNLPVYGLWVTGISVFAIFSRNILRLDSWVQDQADHWLSGWLTLLIRLDNEIDIFANGPGIFGTNEVIKKGIVFPLVHGMGREGLYLAAVPVIIFVLILMASYRLVGTVLTKESGKERAVAFGAMLLLWLSTPLFVGFTTFLHGHGFVALGVAVASRLVIDSLPATKTNSSSEEKTSQELSPWTIGAGLFLATFVMSQSRIESFVLAVLVVLPFLSPKPFERTWKDFWPRLLAVLGGPIGFIVWFASIGRVPIEFASPGVMFLIVMLVAAITVAVLYFAPWVQHLARWAIPAVFVAALVPYLLPIGGTRNNFYFVWLNTFLGEGFWGYTWWFVLATFIVLALDRTKTPRQNLLLWLGIVVILFTLLVKAIDNIGQPSQGNIRDGWSDSVNRSLFHSIPLAIAVGSTALVRFFDRLSRPREAYRRDARASDIRPERVTKS